MSTEKEITDTLKDLHVDWEATPHQVIRPGSLRGLWPFVAVVAHP
jgi:hypothetical protein